MGANGSLQNNKRVRCQETRVGGKKKRGGVTRLVGGGAKKSWGIMAKTPKTPPHKPPPRKTPMSSARRAEKLNGKGREVRGKEGTRGHVG